MTLADQAETLAYDIEAAEISDSLRSKIAENLRQCAAVLRELEGAQQAGQVPKGYKLVPVEPTMEMLSADWEIEAGIGIDDTRIIYAAMLAAAPEAPAQPEQASQPVQEHPACKGMNCGITQTDQEHSPECQAEHAAAIAGGRFVKDATNEPMPSGVVKVCPIRDAACAELPAALRCSGCRPGITGEGT